MSFRATLRTVAVPIGAASLLAALPNAGADESPAPPPDAPVVLHVGDSFVHVGFSQTLKPKFRESGARYVVRAKHSIYTPTIINALGLPDLMRNHMPSLVILNIGANEMRMPQPMDHAPAIRRVSEVVSRGGTSCVWGDTSSARAWTIRHRGRHQEGDESLPRLRLDAHRSGLGARDPRSRSPHPCRWCQVGGSLLELAAVRAGPQERRMETQAASGTKPREARLRQRRLNTYWPSTVK